MVLFELLLGGVVCYRSLLGRQWLKKTKMNVKPTLTLFLILHLSFSANAQTEEKNLVKVLSFNVLGGRTTKTDFNLDAVARVIQDADPDFVALQEVDYKVNRSHQIDLATELGWRTKMASIFGRAMYYDGGEYGDGILSRYTFLTTRNVPLPNIEGQEPRTSVEGVVALPSGDTIAFVSTHFSHEGEPGRLLQAEAINEIYTQNQYPHHPSRRPQCSTRQCAYKYD